MANTNIYAMTDSWNNAAVTFTAIQMNVTDTASDPTSKILDLQLGGSSLFNFGKNGNMKLNAATAQIAGNGNAGFVQFSSSSGVSGFGGKVGYANGSGGWSGWQVASDTPMGFSSSANLGAANDAMFWRDAAGIIAQQNGANAQTFRVYQTFTDTLNYARAALNNTVGQVELAAESAGTGTANIDIKLTPKGTGNVALPGGTLLKTTAALTNGAGAGAGTISNAPAAGNPTKWIPINDAGVTRYIPAW